MQRMEPDEDAAVPLWSSRGAQNFERGNSGGAARREEWDGGR
jgi:hypothetical protein